MSLSDFYLIYIKSFFQTIINHLLDMPYRLRKIWEFFKLSLKDYDYDYAFLLYVEKKKLEDMAIFFEKSNVAEEDWAVARDARICAKLIDIITEQDTSYNIFYENGNSSKPKIIPTKDVNIKNMERFFRSTDCKRYKNGEKELSYVVKDDLRIEKAWNLYNKIRSENMRLWWN